MLLILSCVIATEVIIKLNPITVKQLRRFRQIAQFTQGICDEEKEVYGDSPTRSENLLDSHMELFKADNPAFVNVCGKKIWLNNEPQLLKDYF